MHAKLLIPTLGGILEAARVLHASRKSKSPITSNISDLPSPINPMLLSVPTETVYNLACCVKIASPRSIHKLILQNNDNDDLKDCEYHHCANNEKLNNLIVQTSNASLNWMLNCNIPNSNQASDSGSGNASSSNTHSASQSLESKPCLFVCDASHAENYAHFTKPKTFAIKPSSSTTASLCAANFSESREAFQRLTSKFSPGPVIIYIKPRCVNPHQEVVTSGIHTKKWLGDKL